MRPALLLGFFVSACSGAGTQLDSGAALWIMVPPGECLPAAAGTQRCEQFSFFNQCLSGEAAQRRFMCDLATERREIVGSFTCREGLEWRLALPSSPETCSYANGSLVGATFEDDRRKSIAGYWEFHDCVATELCPFWDGGTCTPKGNASRPCDEDVSHFPFCRPTEAEQRARLCAPDSGSYGRFASACDGGVQLVDVHTGLGPTDTCSYRDGGLIGASTVSDTNTGPVHGAWSLGECAPVRLCP
ncbi:MAG: hypothetical protein Q8L48_37615 [Archangium sp.]|nr:hypothetical protein [Archangium sp.]